MLHITPFAPTVLHCRLKDQEATDINAAWQRGNMCMDNPTTCCSQQLHKIWLQILLSTHKCTNLARFLLLNSKLVILKTLDSARRDGMSYCFDVTCLEALLVWMMASGMIYFTSPLVCCYSFNWLVVAFPLGSPGSAYPDSSICLLVGSGKPASFITWRIPERMMATNFE